MAPRRADADVDGLADLGQAMHRIAEDLDHGIKQVWAGVSAGILPMAVAMAPRRSGVLAASLTATSGPTGARVFSFTEYATVIHWGWAGHNIEANPWIRDAARATEAVWLDRFREGIQDTIDAAVISSGSAFT